LKVTGSAAGAGVDADGLGVEGVDDCDGVVVAGAGVSAFLPQATRLKTIANARMIASVFFIFFFLSKTINK